MLLIPLFKEPSGLLTSAIAFEQLWNPIENLNPTRGHLKAHSVKVKWVCLNLKAYLGIISWGSKDLLSAFLLVNHRLSS